MGTEDRGQKQWRSNEFYNSDSDESPFITVSPVLLPENNQISTKR